MTRKSLNAIPAFIARASCGARAAGSIAKGGLMLKFFAFSQSGRYTSPPYEPPRANHHLQPAAARRGSHALRQRLTLRADRPPAISRRSEEAKSRFLRLAQRATRSRAGRKNKCLTGCG